MKFPIPQYITDNTGKKISVVLSFKDYEKIIDELEELEDLRMYDSVKLRKENSISFDEYLAKRKTKENA